ncbi:hypothetical protein [Actinomadura madurae]|uniref:hypothetical protein n=1 Tax=Actinomadura madurae TaxID=1993 RepID=UPI0020D2417C|nr:hypothetical protein [Actinomadura madurae]MCQ0011496.1 hypothetical protein [Actinomadura madurae]
MGERPPERNLVAAVLALAAVLAVLALLMGLLFACQPGGGGAAASASGADADVPAAVAVADAVADVADTVPVAAALVSGDAVSVAVGDGR